jgi:predicted RNA-binding Zn-ribbon protein involved in translation (DUF1610 family)
MTLAVVMALTLAAGSVVVVRDTIRRRGRWGINLRRVHCPACGESAPVIRKPKNRRQALWGGWTCEACGLECDKWGRTVDEPEEPDAW